MMVETKVYPTQPTDYLPHIIRRCLEKAEREGVPYEFSLNGATVVVSPSDSFYAVRDEVHRQWARHYRVDPAEDAEVQSTAT